MPQRLQERKEVLLAVCLSVQLIQLFRCRIISVRAQHLLMKNDKRGRNGSRLFEYGSAGSTSSWLLPSIIIHTMIEDPLTSRWEQMQEMFSRPKFSDFSQAEQVLPTTKTILDCICVAPGCLAAITESSSARTSGRLRQHTFLRANASWQIT